MMTDQPNYDFFLKLDRWTKKDAALILSGHNPSDYKNLRLTQDDLPQELIASAQLYRIFCSMLMIMNWHRADWVKAICIKKYRKE